MEHLIEQIVVTVVTVYFLIELAMTHFFGRAGIPTLHNRFAHFLFDKHKEH